MEALGAILVGVDGGGTGCRAVVADTAGAVLGQASAGSANYTTDPKASITHVSEAVSQALRDAGLSQEDARAGTAHIGLAGVQTPEDAAAISAAFDFALCNVTDDRPTSVAGALGDNEGVLLAIGTGAIIAHHRKGRTRYVGGWGFHVSDQASGAWLGRRLLERVLLAHDGLIAPSALTQQVLHDHGGDPNSIVRFARDAGPSAYASYGQVVIEAAVSGDPIADGLMHDGAAFLNSCLRTFGVGAGEAICLSGGVGPHYQPYLDSAFRSNVIAPEGTALDGALRLAVEATLRRAPA